MYTCSRFIAHALIGRLRRGAIKRFEVQTESRLMPGSNLHQARSKVNHERAGYTVVGSKISTRLVLLDFLNFSGLCSMHRLTCVYVRMCPHCLNNLVVPFGIYTSFYFSLLLSYYFCIKLLFSHYVYLVRSYVAPYVTNE